MSARGILANPALFEGHSHVPLECVVDYLKLALEYGAAPFIVHHHQLAFMLREHLSRAERLEFQTLTSMSALVDFFTDRNWWSPSNSFERE